MGNIKGEILPKEIKKDIDDILEKQLFNANRYYAESNPNISNLMQKELVENPVIFYRRLVERWNWHNSYYENLLEPAYQSIIRDNVKELSISEIDDLIKIYETSCLVDEATLVMSGSIKKHLNYYLDKISVEDENISYNDAKNMLITPPIETYFARYQIDHLYYIYLLKKNDENVLKFKDYLKNKYHASDEIIFQNRFRKKFQKYIDLSEKDLLNKIKSYKISDSYKVQHFYFTLEHPERAAIRDILIYDNLYEKLIASNLIGISGFLLRSKILEYLNDSKILPNKGYIYEYSNEVVLKCLEQLKLERKKYMEKDVKPYKQRGDTCAIACMMMVLEYYKLIEKANWYDEKRYYKIYGSKFMPGTPFSAIAYYFSKSGLNTTIYHSDKNIFNNDKGALSETNFNLAMGEYTDYLKLAKSKGTNIICGSDINCHILRKNLENGNLVIIAGELSGGYHAILLCGYDNGEFIVCDPLFKQKQRRTIDEINSFMDTSIGKWFISVGDVKEKKLDLINSLGDYNDKSTEYLNNAHEKGVNYVKK